MLGLLRHRTREENALTSEAEPNPAVAFAVGLIYVFRTAAGAKIIRELETAVRTYAADPQALWRLVREGDAGAAPAERSNVIDGTLAEAPRLPAK
jgi:hypothetical protein